MNFPNTLTVLRIFLTCGFIYFFSRDALPAQVTALIVFALASLTDFLDGYWARRYNLVTRFGKIMDPIADKVLILSAFFVFLHKSLIANWIFFIILARETLVTGLRLIAMQRGLTLAAENAGKLKTILQMVGVYLIILSIIFKPFLSQIFVRRLSFGIHLFMMVVVWVTVSSGYSFIRNNRERLFHVR